MKEPAETLTVNLERPIYGGYCLGRYQGKAIMVPYGIPGETVIAVITDERKDFCFASITSIIEKSNRRITPECPYFSICGGCSYLHMGYDNELEFKRTVTEDSLSRIAGLAKDNMPVIDMINDRRYHYRSHATLKARNGVPGFYRKGSNAFVPIADNGCLLLSEELNTWLSNNTSLPEEFRIAVDHSSSVITSFQENPVVVDKAAGISYTRSISRFFQANRFLRERMIETVVTYAGMAGNGTFLDIGCGVGFFSLPLAIHALSGTGIDISGENISWARQNAVRNGIMNITFLDMPSNSIHPARLHGEVIVADPPRAGLDKKTRKTILALKPSVLIYVSCNPATFSRDAKDFIGGGYILEKMSLIDMFPGTHHIELISRFTRGSFSRTS